VAVHATGATRYDGSVASVWLSSINRRSVMFFDRSAGGRPILRSDDQSQTLQMNAVTSP